MSIRGSPSCAVMRSTQPARSYSGAHVRHPAETLDVRVDRQRVCLVGDHDELEIGIRRDHRLHEIDAIKILAHVRQVDQNGAAPSSPIARSSAE